MDEELKNKVNKIELNTAHKRRETKVKESPPTRSPT